VKRRGWIFASVVAAALGLGRAGKVCDLAFSECPSRYSAGIVKVPSEMIWLDSKIPLCQEFVQITNGNAKPPSIIFIIDNSGSMDENDPEVARFNVVSTLLDNIFTFAPSAEVGLVIFTRRLAFDHRENPFFKPAFPGDTAQHDSFVPLTALNKTFLDGRLGIDTLKALLKHDDKGNLNYVTKLPASRNNSGMGRSNTRDGTDISLGFQAAKVAMKDSKSDKGSQYFVFLSDGTPSTPDNGREGMINEFITGAATPSTFTVFFDTQNSTPLVPSTIVQMTGNIKANGYSPSNAKSAYWAINLPSSQLQSLLQTQVIGNVLSLPAAPKSASLAMGDTTYRSENMDSKNFVFPRHLALREDTTRMELTYTYTYVDTTGGKPETKEKTVPYALTFVRAPNAPLPAGAAQACRDQADISLYRNGQPISTVTADDATLEARLTMPDGSLCKDCKLEVTPSTNRVKDREPLVLTPNGGYESGTFQREVSLTPSLNDGRLQHLPGDSIILTYVSPENPLDRVRKAFPYTDVMTVLNVDKQNDFARTRFAPVVPFEPQFTLVAPAGMQAVPSDPTDHWRTEPGPMAPLDSLRYVGFTVEASRSFTVDMHVFSGFGEFVNKLTFTVTPGEFQKLEKGGTGSTRRMKVLWDSRARNGAMVGTGAYIIKTTVTLTRIPGIAEDKAIRTDYRRVGVLRSL
jgi:hypothetical protein